MSTAKQATEVDRAIALMAARQRGVITHAQLIACGLTRRMIGRRLSRGWLHPLHRGVYALGHVALPVLGLEMAAVLACGSGAVLSHDSAAALWGLPPTADTGVVHVTIQGRNCGTREGLRVHRVKAIAEADIRLHENVLPLTSPARTLLDIAATLPDRELERAYEEALVRRLVSGAAMRRLLAGARSRRGCVALRALVAPEVTPTLTRSQAEERFLALIRKAQLPPPAVNVRVGRYEVDFLWRVARLVVEVDGFAFHGGRRAFERDRSRDAELQSLGLRVLRFTWHQLIEDPELVLVRLAQTLALSP